MFTLRPVSVTLFFSLRRRGDQTERVVPRTHAPARAPPRRAPLPGLSPCVFNQRIRQSQPWMRFSILYQSAESVSHGRSRHQTFALFDHPADRRFCIIDGMTGLFIEVMRRIVESAACPGAGSESHRGACADPRHGTDKKRGDGHPEVFRPFVMVHTLSIVSIVSVRSIRADRMLQCIYQSAVIHAA